MSDTTVLKNDWDHSRGDIAKAAGIPKEQLRNIGDQVVELISHDGAKPSEVIAILENMDISEREKLIVLYMMIS